MKASLITPRYNSTSEKILKTVAAQGRRNVGYYRHSLSSWRDQRKWIGNWSNNVKESLSHFILLHYCSTRTKKPTSVSEQLTKLPRGLWDSFWENFKIKLPTLFFTTLFLTPSLPFFFLLTFLFFYSQQTNIHFLLEAKWMMDRVLMLLGITKMFS